MNEEKNEQIEEIKDKLMHPNATSLALKRVPIETANLFKVVANDKFVGDYGMCLKWLLDQAITEPEKMQHIYGILENYEERLLKLENAGPNLQKFKIRKTLGGKEIKIPIQEE